MIDYLPSFKMAASECWDSSARQEYPRAPDTSAAVLPVQNAGILDSLRACQATLDAGQHPIECELRRAPQNINEHAHAHTGARIPAAPTAGRLASKARVPSLERRSHQTVHANYATCIDGQRYRLSKIQQSRDYSPDDGLNDNLMTYKSLSIARKAVHPGLSIIHQYATSQNSI